ncbi:MAG: efflux transporter outer membrane subunit [Pseudomonadota bacterium]
MLDQKVLIACAFLALGACASPPERPIPVQPAPDQWARVDSTENMSDGWLAKLDSPALSALAAEAIQNNYELAQSRAQLEQAQQTLYATRADLLPTLSAGLNGSRRRNVINIISGQQLEQSLTFENFSLGASLRWQPDIWGQFTNATKAAAYTYAAREAAYLDTRRRLIGELAIAWYTWLEAQALHAVALDQRDNAEQSLDIVENGYRQGLNEAVDLYSARSTFAQQQGNVAAALQSRLETAAALQVLSARYPDGDIDFNATLEWQDLEFGTGVPAEIIARRADLQLAWLELLSANADVAVAHRQRFPAFTISADIDDESGVFSDVFDVDPLSWSILGGLAQPLFSGGRLLANQRRAEARAVELEQRYLQLVNTAFSEVENAISNDRALANQYNAAVQQRDNADEALRLSLQQYQRGLSTYTAVLQSQQLAFDARGNVVRLNAQRLRNRINLYVALGSDDTPQTGEDASP